MNFVAYPLGSVRLWKGIVFLRALIFLGLLFFGIPGSECLHTAQAQEPSSMSTSDATTRPKIGVVLSGGAAYGFAHLGVLRWMENHRIPVDYLSGTSMGALVGGFYATGMSVPEIEELLKPVDWDELFRSTTPQLLRDFRRREDYRTFQNDLEFGKGFAATTGLNPGQNIGLLLSQATLPYPDNMRFDDLPIPFRCIASDIDAARPVTFNSGSLSLAMRSSIAIPFVFTTIYRDGQTLLDGGIFDNLPVAVMLPGNENTTNWKPSVVVTVQLQDKAQPGNETGAVAPPNVATSPFKLERPVNAVDVVSRLINAITGENAVRSLERLKNTPGITGIPLTADVSKFGIDNFAEWRGLAAQGEAAAEKNRDTLLKYQLSEKDWATYQKAKESRRLRAFIPRSLVFTEQDQKVPLRANLRASLNRQLEPFLGKTLTTSIPKSSEVISLEHRINRIYGAGLFENIAYDRSIAVEGQPTLAIRAQPKSYGPPFFLVGAALSSGVTNSPQSLVHLRYNQTGEGLEASGEVRGDVILGSRTYLGAEYYRPLNSSFNFIAPSAFYNREQRDLTTDERNGANYSVRESMLQLDAGHTFGKSAEGRIGIQMGYRDYTVPAASRYGRSGGGTVFGVTGRWILDSQDDPVTPRSGAYITLRAAQYFQAPQTSGYAKSEATLSYAAALTQRITILTGLKSGWTLSGAAPQPEQFLLGGPYNMTALAYGELRGTSYRYASGGIRYRVTPQSTLLGGALHLGVYLESVNARRDDGSHGDYTDLQIAAILPSRFGPVSAGFALGSKGTKRLYVNIGRLN